MRKYIIAIALKFQGIPYIWGGASPSGFDCSGFVIWILQVFGLLPAGDWTAQGLSRSFDSTSSPLPGDLVFYGTDKDHIYHVMMYLGDNTTGQLVIGASGGDHTTTDVREARKKNAMVKIKPIDYRSDRQLIVNIEAPVLHA